MFAAGRDPANPCKKDLLSFCFSSPSVCLSLLLLPFPFRALCHVSTPVHIFPFLFSLPLPTFFFPSEYQNGVVSPSALAHCFLSSGSIATRTPKERKPAQNRFWNSGVRQLGCCCSVPQRCHNPLVENFNLF